MRQRGCTIAALGSGSGGGGDDDDGCGGGGGDGDAVLIGRPPRTLGAACGWGAGVASAAADNVVCVRRILQFDERARSSERDTLLSSCWEVCAYSLTTHATTVWARLPSLSELSHLLASRTLPVGGAERGSAGAGSGARGIVVTSIERVAVAASGDAALLLLRGAADGDAAAPAHSEICGCVVVAAPLPGRPPADYIDPVHVHRCSDAIFLAPQKVSPDRLPLHFVRILLTI